MAKEISIKIKVDGQEIDVAKKTTKELNEQIGDLRKKLEEVPVGSKDFKKISGDINSLEEGFKKAKQSQQGFLQNLSELPGLAGTVGQSIKGVKGAFDLLASNPLVAVLTLLAGVVMKVVDKMKNLEGVMDPITKIGAIFSGIFEKLASVVLPPVAFALELIASGAEKVANFFGSLIGAGDSLGTTLGELADEQDRLNDSQAEYELGLSKSNRALAEARERANDQTLSTKERVQALRDAAKIEEQIAEEGRQRALQQARIIAAQMAASMDLTELEITNLRKATAVELEEFAKRIKNRKDLNQEQRTALLKQLGVIDEIAANESKIAKKTDTQIRGIQNAAAADAKAAQDKRLQQTKDYETRLLGFTNDIRLQGIKDEQEKARVSLEIEKKKSIDEIKALDFSALGKKEATKRKNKLIEEAEKDFALKSKNLVDKQNQDNEDRKRAFDFKIEQLDIESLATELERQKANIDAKAYQDKVAMTKDTEFKKLSKEEQARILALIDTKAVNDKKKLDDDAAKKNAELVYKQIEFERQTRVMAIQMKLRDIDNSNKSEIQKIKDRRQLMDEQAKIDMEKELENLKKLLDAKEIENTEYLKRKALIEGNYTSVILGNQIDSERKLTEQRQKNNQALMQLADSIGAVGQAMGEETAAGKALIRVQQALALATTSLAIAQAFMGLGKDLAKGFPVNIIAVASTLALIATAISQFKALTTPFKTEDAAGNSGGTSTSPRPTGNLKPQGYSQGGMINGPRHAAGGTLIEAEGGEAVMSRGAVTLFGPLLSQLNQAGGGTSFGINSMVSSFDNPKSSYPSDYQPNPVQIVKTYVVEGELTSQQQKQARLKDLSTI